MARIRTLQDAIKELKIDDPKCALTYSALRRMVLKNEIPFAKSGDKHLVDVDIILDALFKHKEVVSNEFKQAK